MPRYSSCKKCRIYGLSNVYVPVAYDRLSKKLVWKLKYGSARDGSIEVAELIRGALGCAEYDFVVPAPTTTKRSRQRGYDQAKLIAKELSKQAKLPYQDLVVRTSNIHQVGSSRATRKAQVKDAFRVKRPDLIKGASILLVDDVITTGSTLEAVAKILKKAGAKTVSAAVFAQTE